MSQEDLLQHINPVIESQACWIAWSCQHFSSGEIDWQDLIQAADVLIEHYVVREVGALSYECLSMIAPGNQPSCASHTVIRHNTTIGLL